MNGGDYSAASRSADHLLEWLVHAPRAQAPDDPPRGWQLVAHAMSEALIAAAVEHVRGSRLRRAARASSQHPRRRMPGGASPALGGLPSRQPAGEPWPAQILPGDALRGVRGSRRGSSSIPEILRVSPCFYGRSRCGRSIWLRRAALRIRSSSAHISTTRGRSSLKPLIWRFPPFALVVSVGLVPIGPQAGPIEIAAPICGRARVRRLQLMPEKCRWSLSRCRLAMS